MLLHDTHVLHSRNLLEIPHLVRRFGIEAVIRLFKSSSIELSLDKSAVGLLAVRDAPPDPYVLRATAVHLTQPASMNADFDHLRQTFDVQRKSHWRSLTGALHGAIDRAPPSLDELGRAPRRLMADVREAVLSPGRFDPFVYAALRSAGHEPRPIRLGASEIDKALGFETDMASVYGFSDDEAGAVLRSAFMALSTEMDRANEMRLYHALTYFDADDAPLFGHHLSHAVQQAHPDTPKRAFDRVVEVKGLPNLRDPAALDALDLHRLLEARETPEAQSFRDWLWTVGTRSDQEVAEEVEYHVASLGKRAAWFLKTPTGRRLRWLAATAVGLGAGTVDPMSGKIMGAGLGAINAFLVDSVIPDDDRSRPAAFIGTTYPSLFNER